MVRQYSMNGQVPFNLKTRDIEHTHFFHSYTKIKKASQFYIDLIIIILKGQMQHEVVIMDRKMFIIAAVLSCCLIFSVVSAATTTPAGNATNVTKVVKTTTPTTASTGNVTSTATIAKPAQPVNTTTVAKIMTAPKVVSITPSSGTLGNKVAFNVTGSDFDKTAKVYLETEVKNKTKTIEAAKNTVVSNSLISGNFKMPTNVPAGDWNVVVKQNGKESSTPVKFTIKE